jgi:hypothetical protein
MLIPGEHPVTRLYVRLSRQDVPQQCVGEKILSTVTLEDERPEPMPFLRAKHFLERGVQLGCVGRGWFPQPNLSTAVAHQQRTF